MIIKAEIYQGSAYLLTEWGDVWKVKLEHGRSPLIEQLAQSADHNQIRLLCEPTLPRLFDRSYSYGY